MGLVDNIGCKDEGESNSKTPDIFKITPLKYLRMMYTIARECFLHPTKISTIDYKTLEVVRK